jgi:acyl-coenzyme A synthetase/AMP-(fatty) acid ligase
MKRRLGLVEGKKPGKLGPDKIDTGDIFEIDDDNYLYMVGRNSDFIVCRGEKVCLASVRRAAETIPGVVSAKTRVQCGADGDTSFILDILMRTSHGNAAASIRNRLSKLLLAAERPSFIHVREVGEGALK